MTKAWIADRWRGSSRGTGLRWRVVWPDPETKRETSKSFAKKADAEAFRTKTEDSLRGGTYVSAQVAALTVGDAVDAWLASKRKPKEASMRRYRDAIENYVLPRWRDTLLSSLKREHIDAWLSALLDGSAPRREDMAARSGGVSPATVRSLYAPLNAALRHAHGQGWIRFNPATGVELPRLSGDPVVFLTHEQMEALIQAARDHGTASDAAMVAVLGNVGLRPGEAAALTVQDVNLTARRIHVSKTLTVDADRRTVVGSSPKTEAGIRDVPIPPHLVPDLHALTRGREPDAPLFTTASGRALNLANWRNRTWKRITQAAGSPVGLTPKSLRHTAASLAIAAGADVLVVQRMLGHASATETLETYAKLWPDRLDEVTDAMSKARKRALKKAAKRPDRT